MGLSLSKASLALALLLASPCLRAGEPDPEIRESQVDRAALASQDKAIAALEALAKKHAGTERELAVRMRIVEAHQQAAKIQFRLSHSQSNADLARYHRRLRNIIDAVSALVAKFPENEGVEAMYVTRAEAYRELDDKADAQRDYAFVSTHFPQSAAAVGANVSLGALATEAGNYREAILQLQKVERLENEQYPFVLHQIAWANFNLDDVSSAIGYLKRRQEFYRKKAEKAGLSSADRALQEQGLRDIASFYFSRYDKRDPKFPLREAIALFKTAEPGAYLGKMLSHMASLLKSRQHPDGLDEWTGLVVDADPGLPEALDVATVNLEAFIDKPSLDPSRTLRHLTKLDEKTSRKVRDLPAFSRVLTLLLQGAAGLQDRLKNEKSPEGLSKIRHALSNFYGAFAALAKETHPSYASARFNLAEVLFAESNFEGAAREFRWLVDHPTKLQVSAPTVSLKALASEYRVLLAKGLLPKDSSPGKLSGEKAPALGSLPAAQGDWMKKVKAHLDEHGRKPEGIEEFEYEGYRLLYANNQTRAAVSGMTDLVKDRPRAPASLPAAKLVLDTYLVSEDWEGVKETADTFKKLPFTDEAFRKRLANVTAETAIRVAEQAANSGDFAKSAALSQEFARKNPTSPFAPHALLLAARAALETKDLPKGKQLLADLLSRYPNAENRGVALLLRAGLAETDYDFDEAARNLRQALALRAKGEDRAKLARRYFFASWVSLHPEPLDCAAFSEPQDLQKDCDRYQGLIAWATIGKGTSATDAVEKALKGNEETRPIWSAVALKIGMSELGWKERIGAAKALATRWKTLDPLIQFVLIPALNRSVPEAFEVSQKTLPKFAPLRANSKSLVRRIGLIKDMETATEAIVEAPWAQVKAALLASLAETYRDFCEELAKLPRPKDLSPDELKEYDASVTEILTPFRAKAETIRGQVKKLAAQFPIDPKGIASWEGVPASRTLASTASHEADLLRGLLEQIPPNKEPEVGRLSPEKLAPLWATALKEGAWARSGFLFSELKERVKGASPTLTALRALALARAGAKAEALDELESARPELAPPLKIPVNRVLQAWYETSSVPSKAQAFESGAAPQEGKP